MQDKATKKMLRRNRHRAEFSGFSYFFGSLLIAAACYFPMIYGVNVAGMGAGSLWVANFWKAFLLFPQVTTDLAFVVVNALPSVIYAILLLVVTINLICQIVKLHRLYRKKPSEKSGYNRNVDTMEKMGKIFSCSFFTTVALVYIIHLLTGAKLTAFFYVIMFVAFLIHFIAGVKGAKTSLFLNGENPVEDKRKWGRFAPFIRNAAQFLFVGVILYFLAKASIVTNLYKLLNANAFTELFKDLTNTAAVENLVVTLVLPAVQVLILVFSLIMLKHATNTTEYNRKGRFGRGMKNFGLFAFFVFLFAALYEVGCYLLGCTNMFGDALDVYPTMNMLYVGVAGFAAFLEEVCMAKLPNVRKNYQEAVIPEPVAEEVKEEEKTMASAPVSAKPNYTVAPNTVYSLPVKCVSEPGVFMQPNGVPVMVMPMVPVTVQAPQPMPEMIHVEPTPAPVVEEVAPVAEETAVVAEEPAPAPAAPAATDAKADAKASAKAAKAEDTELDEATLARIRRAKELKAKWVAIGKNGVN